MTKRTAINTLVGIIALATLAFCALNLARAWQSYYERANATAEVCEIGPPARCIRAREAG